MEQILAFVLGVSAVAFVWVVVVAFKTAKLAKQNEQSIVNIEQYVSRYDELLNRRIDQEIDRVDQIYSECMRYTDSRVDKLEAKLLSVDKDGCEPTKKLIKG
jgi:septation ring formation regulator EzrA